MGLLTRPRNTSDSKGKKPLINRNPQQNQINNSKSINNQEQSYSGPTYSAIESPKFESKGLSVRFGLGSSSDQQQQQQQQQQQNTGNLQSESSPSVENNLEVGGSVSGNLSGSIGIDTSISQNRQTNNSPPPCTPSQPQPCPEVNKTHCCHLPLCFVSCFTSIFLFFSTIFTFSILCVQQVFLQLSALLFYILQKISRALNIFIGTICNSIYHISTLICGCLTCSPCRHVPENDRSIPPINVTPPDGEDYARVTCCCCSQIGSIFSCIFSNIYAIFISIFGIILCKNCCRNCNRHHAGNNNLVDNDSENHNCDNGNNDSSSNWNSQPGQSNDDRQYYSSDSDEGHHASCCCAKVCGAGSICLPCCISDLFSSTILFLLTFIALLYSQYNYAWEKFHSNEDILNAPETTFTLHPIFYFVFWGILFFMQLVYISTITRKSRLAWTAGHSVIFNLLVVLWNYFVVQEYYLYALIVSIVLVINSFVSFIRTSYIRPRRIWLSIHVPASTLPFAWAFYSLIWSIVLFIGTNAQVIRILSNVLIWLFLFVPCFAALFSADFTTPLVFALLSAGIGLEQYLFQVISLQWIFAFIITGLLVVATICTMVSFACLTQVFSIEEDYYSTEEEQTPLLLG